MLASASYVVANLARQIEPGDVVFTGVNSSPSRAFENIECSGVRSCFNAQRPSQVTIAADQATSRTR